MQHKTLLEIKEVKWGYGANPLTDQAFNTQLHAPSLIMLMGANGTGKSTLLRNLGGLENPLQGEILLNHAKVSSSQVGFVFSHRPQVEFMKLIDLVASGSERHYRLASQTECLQDAQIANVLEKLGVSHLAMQGIDTLSDGEFQKAMIARCLLKDAPLMLLDEPTAFLDYRSKRNLMLNLKEIVLNHQKIAIITTHDPDMAIAFADQIWLIQNRQIQVFMKDKIDFAQLTQLLQ
jgi:iron complex transport system ATP-binding protein